MRVSRILYPITTLGPGNRVVVWTAGCSKACPRCENPELWHSTSEQEISPEQLSKKLIQISKAYDVHCLTMTGGDPLEQAEELLSLLKLLRPFYSDVLVYTGYTFQEIEASFTSEQLEQLKALMDVMIDGRYEDRKNDNAVPLRGSTNQNVIFLADNLKDTYKHYMNQGRQVQNVVYNGNVISVGIHNRESTNDRRP